MIVAAGILAVSPEGKALFLRRATGADSPGVWCLPGGVVEAGESHQEAACREFSEESGGQCDPAVLKPWTRRMGGRDGKAGKDEVDFTTFILTGVNEFEPKINDESDSAIWAPLNSPPQPLHPGCAIALARCSPGWTELDTARAIKAGELVSPQKYENVWMFAVRITGTGIAYRHSMNEYVWRDKNLYLNDEFLQRCNGLPVIMEHPKSNVLNSEEFNDRMVGVVVLPYIKGDEVWGIAKIYDDTAAQMMRDDQLSTSPAVVWRSPDSNDSHDMNNGQKFLIEGKPSLLDHLAICKVGVWDKGGEPVGIDSKSKGDLQMADDTKADAKADQSDLASVLAGLKAIDGKMDTLAARLDSVEDRVRARGDAFPPEEAAGDGPPPEVMDKIEAEGDADPMLEGAPPVLEGEGGDEITELPVEDDEDFEGDPEPLAVDADRVDSTRRDAARRDAARRDAARKDTNRKDAARRDAARKDAARRDAAARGDSTVTLSRKDYDTLMKRFDSFEAKIPKQLDDAEYDKFAAAQARADAVYSGFGKSAPRPMQGESLLAYRRRLLTDLKEHSPDWKNSDLRVVAVDDGTMTIAENQIFIAAQAAVRNPASVPLGMLREIKNRNDAGHTMTTFVGSPSAWMTRFAPTGRAIRQINQMNKGSNVG